ncbi:ATP-binding protein [Siminovitchia sp. FSL W7-1587]|uniref:sensor histidine kinase n=1 Tax=Siminovitchia sp. FSL W7-1587 TaxID=2954699 RepID=UPI0030CC9655
MKWFQKSNIIFSIMVFLKMGLILYFGLLILQYPLIGIEVEHRNGKWIVEHVYDKGWATKNKVEKGDIVQAINGIDPGEHKTVIRFNSVEKAKSITIADQQANTNTYAISYKDVDVQYFMYLFLPLLLCLATFFLGLFFYCANKEESSAMILVCFLFSLGLCYLSAPVSARADLIGRMTVTVTFPGSLVLLIHFLKSYFSKHHLEFVKDRMINILYIAYFLVLTSHFFFNGEPRAFTRMVELVFFILLVCLLLFLLARLYYKYKHSEGKTIIQILLTAFVIAFSPFIILYAIPHIFWGKGFVSAELASMFLLVIPLAFVYLQRAKKLFDIEFLLGRLQYYALLSFALTTFAIIILITVFDMKILSGSAFLFFFLFFIVAILFLYIKEYIDYRLRHHLFCQKNHVEANLHNFFQKAKHETKVNGFIASLLREIKEVLRVKEVHYINIQENKDLNRWIVKNQQEFSFSEEIEQVNWRNCHPGSLIEVQTGFCVVIGEHYHVKEIIFCGLKKYKTTLNIQEKIWLENIAYFSSVLLENFKLIEGLFEEIEHYHKTRQNENESYPSWLSRLLFSLSEKERMNLSIDLHDTILQDQLQLLRDIEAIKTKMTDPYLKESMYHVKETILDNIHLIRETCNELRPPFLSELGLIQSIQNLIERVKLRSNFLLHADLDPTIQRMVPEDELTVYRVIQELLNNAMKHSKASEVSISLKKINRGFMLSYIDNGIGIRMSELNDSFKTMGIYGIKERVRSMGGKIKIESAQNQGLKVQILYRQGDNEIDQSVNCG